MRKLLIISWKPYSINYYVKFDIKVLKKYFNVSFISISKIFFPKYPKIYFQKREKTKKDGINVYELKNIKSLKKILSKNNFDYCIDAFNGNYNFNILNLIKEYKIKTINILGGSKLSKNAKFPRNILFILRKLYWQLSIKNSNYDYCFLSGTECIMQNNISYKNIIFSHSFDYDLTLRSKNKKKNKPYAVFIDENMIDHPDFFTDTKIYFDRKRYYKNLTNFFLFFEKYFKIKVIIAAHPTIKDSQLKYFNGHKVCKNHTSELIKNSSYVLLHQSTAINFAIIYKKKMVILADDIFNNHYLGLSTESNAIFFKKPVLDISKNYNLKTIHQSMILPNYLYRKYMDFFNLHPKKIGKSSIAEQLNLYLK